MDIHKSDKNNKSITFRYEKWKITILTFFGKLLINTSKFQ